MSGEEEPLVPIPGAIALYADGFAGTPNTVSVVFDTSKFRLAGDPKAANQKVIQFFMKEAYEPTPGKPGEKWLTCAVTDNEGAANCGAGKANVFFSKEDGVTPPAQQIGAKWIITVRGQPAAPKQHWRFRVAVQVFPIK
jgi:hypothetical protein